MTKPKKRKNSRAKGARGELELAGELTGYGYPAERAQQYKGGQHSADIHCPSLADLVGAHIECKHTAKLNLYDALRQAQSDAGEGQTPIVMHRRTVKAGQKLPWVAILTLDDFMSIISRIPENGQED